MDSCNNFSVVRLPINDMVIVTLTSFEVVVIITTMYVHVSSLYIAELVVEILFNPYSTYPLF